jgi:hypothetical protein
LRRALLVVLRGWKECGGVYIFLESNLWESDYIIKHLTAPHILRKKNLTDGRWANSGSFLLVGQIKIYLPVEDSVSFVSCKDTAWGSK